MANELGSYSNPYSYEAYENLFSEGNWTGGHVIYDGITYYYNSEGIQGSDGCEGCEGCGCGCGEGCGCGCGCGCGEGCGCGGYGLVSGSEQYRPAPRETILLISWGNGSFLHGGQPPLSVTVFSGPNSTFQYSWDNAFSVKIVFDDDPLAYFYNIPHQYRR